MASVPLFGVGDVLTELAPRWGACYRNQRSCPPQALGIRVNVKPLEFDVLAAVIVRSIWTEVTWMSVHFVSLIDSRRVQHASAAGKFKL